MRFVKVRVWHLTDQELDDLVAECEGMQPGYAAELRRLTAWRRDHPASPPTDNRGSRLWSTDAELAGSSTHWEFGDAGELAVRQSNWPATEAGALAASAHQVGLGSFDEPRSPELTERTQSAELQAAGCRRCEEI